MDFADLTKEQLDTIRELGNIGSGNAATAMGQFLNTRIDMEIPAISVREFDEVTALMGDPDEKVAILQFSILGDIKGNILFAVNFQESKEMVKILLPDTDVSAPYSEMERSCLMEMGNILASAFVIALSNLTKKFMSISIPRFNQDMFGAVLSQVIAEVALEADDMLVFETHLINSGQRVKMHLLLMVPPSDIHKLLGSVGMLEK